MYTEENEFDYNEYLNENSEQNYNNKSSNKGLIIKALLIFLCLFIRIFLVFKIKNNNSNNNSNIPNKVDNVLVFNNNVANLKTRGEIYFFESENYPKEVGEESSVTINNLIGTGLVTEVLDYDGSTCGYNTSYLSMTRNHNYYLLKIFLRCPSMEDSVTYYYDLEYNCLNPNGEEYTPDEDIETEVEDENQEQDSETQVCGDFSEWTTEYIADNSLEKEERTVIIAYKDNIVYGEWSEPTQTPIEPSENLEVKVEEKQEMVSKTTDWIDSGTTKPEEKEGREIESSTESVPYSSKVANKVTYTETKELTKWDNTADRCTTKSFGKVTCTYTKTKTVYDYVTKYKTVTNYKYRDTTQELVNFVYYTSRTITKGETIYTDYILESEMPEGYQKVVGSEVTQYRYRDKCSK